MSCRGVGKGGRTCCRLGGGLLLLKPLRLVLILKSLKNIFMPAVNAKIKTNSDEIVRDLVGAGNSRIGQGIERLFPTSSRS